MAVLVFLEAFISVTLIYDTFVIKYVHSGVCFLLHVSLILMVLVTEVVLRKEIWVLGQRGADLLLFLEASGVGDLDMAALGGRFIYNLLQPGVELAVHMVWRGIIARVLFVSSVTAMLGRDLIQNLRLGLLLA